MKGDRKFAPLFGVWWIDALPEGDNGWVWNDTHKLFEFRTESMNVKRAFLSRLRKFMADPKFLPAGSGLGRGWYYVSENDNVLELRKKASDEPVVACIRASPG